MELSLSKWIFCIFLFILFLIIKVAQNRFKHVELSCCPYFSALEIEEVKNRLSNEYSADLIKRFLDIAIAFLILPIIFPLLLLLCFLLLIQKQSPFFCQYRHGLNGVPFKIIKLRTLHSKTGQYLYGGSWLRRIGLDEIPQIWNILLGEMSFVGPRPEVISKMLDLSPLEQIRLLVRPGLTGFWQLSPYRNEEIAAHIEYDIAYVLSRNIWIDFILIMLTPFCIGPKLSKENNSE